MKNLSKKICASLAALTLLASCGKTGGGSSGSGNNGQQRMEEAPADGSNIDGHYQATFTTLNSHVNGTIPGSANFVRKEDKLFAYIRLFAGGMKAWHQQYVYTGSRCPNMNDDTNLDGFIDINEAEAVLGKIIIPMDSDISTQSSGRRFFPLADPSGSYQYERVTSFRRFLSDLQSEDKDPNDDTIKLAEGEGLRLAGKTFLVQGVAETVQLPETVGSKGRFKAFQTFPIACGVFKKVSEAPGTPYISDALPGPVASVQEGWDRPADDQIPEPTTGGSTSGTTTGTNDSEDGDGPVSDGNGSTHTTGGTTTSGSTTGSGTTTGGTTGGTTGRTTSGSTTGGSTIGETTGGSTTGGTTSGGTTSGGSTTGGSSSSSTTTTTTTTGGSSSSSSSSTSTGSTTGGFLDSSSGV